MSKNENNPLLKWIQNVTHLMKFNHFNCHRYKPVARCITNHTEARQSAWVQFTEWPITSNDLKILLDPTKPANIRPTALSKTYNQSGSALLSRKRVEGLEMQYAKCIKKTTQSSIEITEAKALFIFSIDYVQLHLRLHLASSKSSTKHLWVISFVDQHQCVVWSESSTTNTLKRLIIKCIWESLPLHKGTWLSFTYKSSLAAVLLKIQYCSIINCCVLVYDGPLNLPRPLLHVFCLFACFLHLQYLPTGESAAREAVLWVCYSVTLS